MKNWKYINGSEDVRIGNASHTKEEAKTKDEYFKLLKFYQVQGYTTKAGEYNPNGSIKLHKGDDSVEIVLVGNDTPAEYAKRPPKVVGGNSKCGNTARLIGEQKFKDLRVFYYKDDTDNVYYVSDKDQGPFGKIFDNGAFKTFEEAKRYVREKISRIPAYNSLPEEADKEFFHKLAKDAKEHDEAADKEIDKVGNEYKPNAEVIKVLEALWWKRISADEARAKLEKLIGDKNIADLMVHNPANFIPAGNRQVGNAKEWEVKESDVIEYINGDPNATVIQRICQKHLGTYDTSGVQALLVDEKANKWAVVKRGVNAKMKVGNDAGPNIVGEYNEEIMRLTRKAEQLRRMGQGKSAIEVEKQIEKLGKELREYTKVGNAKDKNGKELKVGDKVRVNEFGKPGKITKIIGGDVVEVYIDNSGTYSPDRIDRYYDSEVVKVGNSWVGVKQPNGKYMPVEEGFSYYFNGKKLKVVEINGTEIKLSDGSKIKGGPSGQAVEVEMKKVGNRMLKYTSKTDSKKEFLYDEQTGDLEVWYDGKKVDSLKNAGEGWKKYIETHAIRTGNSKVGNRSWRTEKNGDRVTIYLNDWKAGWGEVQEWQPLGWVTIGYTYGMTPSGMKSGSPFRKVYKDKKPSLEQIEKDLKEDFWAHHNNKETMAKVGNSASDDKFAYVMREFDEGKLKTPDGKVVTDPAQAKAIAYSESKKTENGLARARNAMAKNKKVGNVDLPKNVKKSDFSIRTFRENGAWSYEIKGPNGYKDGYHGFTEESIAKREAQEEIDFLVSGKEV